MASTSTASEADVGWSGVFPYIPTPLDSAGRRLQPDKAHALIDRLVAAGVHGISPLGSTGEAPLVSDSVRADMVATAVEASAGRVPVIPGICGFSTVDLRRQAVRVQRLGADGILVVLLAYFPLTADEVLSAVSVVADSVEIPLVMYHHPAFCGVSLDDETVRRLHQDCGVRYMKDASGDADSIARWRGVAGPDLRMFAATAVSPVAAMASGACGLMSGPATVFPAESVRLVENAAGGDTAGAAQEEQRLRPALDFFRRVGPARAVKALLAADGEDVGPPVPPLAPLTRAEIASAARCLAQVRSG